jgi:phenylpropionate dioxygenase-like ring-hydroxylating dioxygenase large terminal subunit
MSYVRNAWYVASWTQDLPATGPFAVTIMDERIVIYRGESGRLIALEDRCVHRLAPLSLGRCEGEQLRCLYHGLLFNPDGTVAEIPGQDQIPAQARIKSYPVVDRHSWVWIWMGDPAKADPAFIPPAVGPDDPDWLLGHGHLQYDAEARLINDNLLDFSHLSYVHPDSFGATESWARNRPKVTPIERGIRVTRWMTDQPGMNGRESEESKVKLRDRWTTYDFFVPGVMLMTGGTFPVGTAKALNYEAPDLAKAEAGVTFTSQAISPVSSRTARYFFSWGPRADQGTEEIRDMLMGIARKAFDEDRVIIEAQQKVIDQTPHVKIMPTTSDKAVVLYNRLVEKMAREEQALRSESHAV